MYPVRRLHKAGLLRVSAKCMEIVYPKRPRSTTRRSYSYHTTGPNSTALCFVVVQELTVYIDAHQVLWNH